MWKFFWHSLFAGLNTNIFKEIEFLFYKAVNGDSSITESPSADSTQVIFHVATPLRFVTMYSFFSNFWRICSSIECFISLELASVKPCRVGIAHQKMGNCMDWWLILVFNRKPRNRQSNRELWDLFWRALPTKKIARMGNGRVCQIIEGYWYRL